MIPSDARLRYKILFNTMTSERYCEILDDIVLPTLNNVRYNQYFYQQDGASVHWANSVRTKLDENLTNRWIGRSGPIAWPPRSPDLTINDFWLWGYLRDTVYRDPRPNTLEELTG